MLRVLTGLIVFGITLLPVSSVVMAAEECRVIAGAETADTSDDVSVCTQQTYFHCASDRKLANIDHAVDSKLPSWDTVKPTKSVTEGAGCGWADNSALRSPQAGDSPHDGAWRGTFAGNLSSMTVQLHGIPVGPGRTGAAQRFNVTLFVDGTSVFGVAGDGRAARKEVTITPVPSSTGASSLYEFTIRNLAFAAETGAGSEEREIILNVAAASEPVMGWVYDTTEVPSGIAFNPATHAAVKINP